MTKKQWHKEWLEGFKAANTIEDLEASDIGGLDYRISHRGGTLGFRAESVANTLDIPREYFPNMVGAYVNYLGGGIRGAICSSTYSDKVPADKAILLDALIDACKRAYENAENESGLNAEEDEDGDTNWEAIGTAGARRAGIKSAY